MTQGLAPPTIEFFGPSRPAAGSRDMGLVLGGLRIDIGGLDDDLAEQLGSRYRPYAGPASRSADALQVRLGREDRDYFIDPPGVPELNRILIACDGDRVRYLGYQIAGWFDVFGGQGEILLARGSYEPPLRAIENYVRAAVAWQAAARGGALVHGASAAWRGRGYLFYGESGAGKSTLSACNTRAQVISDDLSLVLPRPGDGLDLVGSPFRGTYEGGEPVLGRFPLAAGFRIVQAQAAEVRKMPRVRVFAELVGNLPFVAEAFARRPDLLDRVERAFARVPLAHLHFRKDDSYWGAIERAGL